MGSFQSKDWACSPCWLNSQIQEIASYKMSIVMKSFEVSERKSTGSNVGHVEPA